MFEIVLESIQPLLNTLVPTFTGLLGLYIGVKLTERSQHSLEKMKQHHQLSMAAIDKRLEAHQGAYSKWWKLANHIFDANLGEMSRDCEKFIVNNCIYLGSDLSTKFKRAINAADLHKILVDRWKTTQTEENAEKVEQNFEKIQSFGDEIQKAVNLPPITVSFDRKLNAFGKTSNS